MKDKEFRSVTFNAPAGNSRTIAGSIPYNSASEDLGFIETLDPQCFVRTLREMKDCTVLYQHNEERPLARTKNGSLRFNNTPNALDFEFDVPETTDGNDLLTLVRSGVISGCSFGMQVMRDSWGSAEGHDTRRILEARLFHISPVTTPAYSESSLYCRSLSRALEGKELDTMDKEQIKAEIEKLRAMLDESNPQETSEVKPIEQADPVVAEVPVPPVNKEREDASQVDVPVEQPPMPEQEPEKPLEEAACQKREDDPMMDVKEELVEKIQEAEAMKEAQENPVDMAELEDLLARLAAAEEKIRKYCGK